MALKMTHIALVLALIALCGPFQVEGCKVIHDILHGALHGFFDGILGMFGGGERRGHAHPKVIYGAYPPGGVGGMPQPYQYYEQ